jgi:hypothetical protein
MNFALFALLLALQPMKILLPANYEKSKIVLNLNEIKMLLSRTVYF